MTGKKKEDAEELNSAFSKFSSLPKESKIKVVCHLIEELKRMHGVSEREILAAGKSPVQEILIPSGVFGNDVLSSLEAIVKYLKEESKLKFSRIAKLTNRSSKTIWATYQKSIKKFPLPFGPISSDLMVPVSVFSSRSLSALESVVAFIKDADYSNHEVAQMLHLDDRTIWTVYDRVKKKRGMK